jgi:UPF0755 protein
LLAFLLILGAGFYALQLWGGPGPARQNVSVLVPEGASLSRAASELEKAGAVRSARMFLLFAKVLGGSEGIKAGEYRIPARLSEADVLKLLQGGKTLQRMVTIPEGTPSILVYETLMKAPQLEGEIRCRSRARCCQTAMPIIAAIRGRACSTGCRRRWSIISPRRGRSASPGSR